ncbi:MAG: hypothetical protein OXC07_12235, partial [Kistimonas sp.]|nr:hypothetical protein [Kistimonas sp.]
GGEHAPATAGQLKHLVRARTTNKVFVCSQQDCGYSSTKSGNLTRHGRIHRDKNPLAVRVTAVALRCPNAPGCKRI